ncbi:hypothetical protein KJ570_02795 [Patescibacteria group bacterium]|nr:hypothetical protein [Patescibacteria group bacterium]MBU2036093.1 hypothetical protein [Patescibacteria group bacterium]
MTTEIRIGIESKRGGPKKTCIGCNCVNENNEHPNKKYRDSTCTLARLELALSRIPTNKEATEAEIDIDSIPKNCLNGYINPSSQFMRSPSKEALTKIIKIARRVV